MKIRDIIFWVHLITGIAVGLVVLIMSVTGAMLAFRGEIIDMSEHDVRTVTPSEGKEQLSVNALISQVREAYPERKAKGVVVKSDPKASVLINFGREEGNVYVNPYTGVILGSDSPVHEFLEKVESWHRWLAMEGKLKPIGHNIKGVTNIAFLFLIITGFYLWWPRKLTWKIVKANAQFNSKLKGNARDWNWHNVIGFWCAPLLIVITLTGVIMSYKWANNLLYRMAGSEPPVAMGEKEGSQKPGKGKADGKQSKTIDFDILIAQAKQQAPNWSLINVRVQKPDAPINIFIENKDSGYVPKRSQLTLDLSTAEIIKWEPYAEQNLGRKLRTLARYLHTGEAGGIVGQLVACVAACGAVMLVWTGFFMSWRRFFTLKKS